MPERPGDNPFRFDPLLEGLDEKSMGRPLPKARRATLGERWSRWLDGAPGRRARLRAWSPYAAGLAVMAAAVAGYFAWRPVPKPDFEEDPFDDVLFYALLTEDFNSLSLDERLSLIKDLIGRFKGMDESEIPIVAAFAAGIQGQARKQLEKNASRLGLDLFDRYAIDYDRVSEEDRSAYLERAFVEFSRTMEEMAGEVREISDEQRLAAARKAFTEDIQRLRTRERDTRDVGNAVAFMNDVIAPQTTGPQRARMTKLMRDMSRHFREPR
ncbi:MAG: hypothetical protein HRU70_06480 [Phycisphaeraceae bacterium]|nr:MAG: hypothetical protein HRU70_06480 [Phycisphaeraceae bacterium]